MALKVTIFYNQFAQGWTETYYVDTMTSPADWLNAQSALSWYPFVSFRHYSTILYAVRASVVGQPRIASTTVYSGSNSLYGTVPSGSGIGPDVSSTDAFLDLYDSSYHKRPIYIRGLNDSDVIRNNNGQSVPSAALNTGMNSMVSAMIAKKFAIQALVLPAPGALGWYAAVGVNVAQTNDSQALIQTNVNPAGYVGGTTRVVFQKIPTDDLPGFPRIATVLYEGTVGNPGIYIAYRPRVSGVLPYAPAAMRFTQLVYGYYPIIIQTFVHFAERKTGRAFGVPRGRSRAKVRAL